MQPSTEMMSYQNPPIIKTDGTAVPLGMTITPPTMTTTSKRMMAIVAVAGMLLLMAGGAVLMLDGGSSYHDLSGSGSITSTAARIPGTTTPTDADVDDDGTTGDDGVDDGPTIVSGTDCGRGRYEGCWCGLGATGTLWACDHLLYCDEDGTCAPEQGKPCGWSSWCEGGNSFRCCEGKCSNQRVCHHGDDDDYQ